MADSEDKMERLSAVVLSVARDPVRGKPRG